MTLRERARQVWLAATGRYPPVGLVPDVPDWRIGMFWSMNEIQLTNPEAYKKVSIVRAVVDRIMNDCARAPKRFYQGEGKRRKEIERSAGNIVDVWQGGNLRDSGLQVTRDIHGNLEIHWNAYLFLERGKGAGPSAKPYATWVLPSHLVEPIEGANRVPEGYLWLKGGAREFMRRENIIHIRGFNPLDEPVAPSWFEACADDIAATFWMRQTMKEHWRHGGVSPGLFKIDPNVKVQPPKEAEIRALQERHERLNQTPKTRTRLHVIYGLEPVGTRETTKDLDLAGANALLEANIARTRGVPPWMVGIKETGALGQVSAEADLVTYIENTLKPTTDLVDSVLNEQFCPLFGQGIKVETDFSGFAAMVASRIKMLEGITKAAGRPPASLNELRPWVNLEPRPEPEADELYTAPPPGAGFGADDDEGEGEGPESGRTEQPKSKAPKKSEESKGRASENGSIQAGPRDDPPSRLDLTRERLAKIAAAELRLAEAATARLFVEFFDAQEAYATEHAEHLPLAKDPLFASMLSRREPERFALELDDLFEDEDEIRRRMQSIFEALIVARGASAAAAIGEELAIDVASTAWQAWIRGQVDRALTNVQETTRKELREKIAQALAPDDEGKVGGLREVVEAVHEVFEGRRANALTIARTETLPAYNRAAMDVWSQGGIEEFEWLTARDGNPRHPSYEGLDGQVRRRGELFQVGDAALEFPGDPNGPPGETINCKCTLLPVIPKDFTRSHQNWWDALQAEPHRNGNGHVPTNRIKHLVEGA